MNTYFSKMPRVSLNQAQRLLLYGGASFWFLAFVRSQQRNYQDSWPLEDVFWPFVALIGIFLYVYIREDDNRIVALLCGWTIIVANLIPALKYVQPYGTTIDVTEHFLMVKSLIMTGRVNPDHIYASIPAMHAWLASLGLTGQLPPEIAYKYGLPLTGGIMPLLVHTLCRQVEMPASLAKYTLGMTCLSPHRYFLASGTGFTLVPLLMLLGVLVLNDFYVKEKQLRSFYTFLTLAGVTQLVIWHSTTPMALPAVLVVASLTPTLVWFLRQATVKVRLSYRLLLYALMALILFMSYHLLEADRVFAELLTKIQKLILSEEAPPSIIPPKGFEVTIIDLLRSAAVGQGQFAVVVGLTIVGLIAIWRSRKQWNHLLPFYAYFFLISSAFGVTFFALGFTRLRLPVIALAPFFAGPALYWFGQILESWTLRGHKILKLAWVPVIFSLAGLTLVSFFIYQPLIPKVKPFPQAKSEEYLVWFHGVNSAFQDRMINFAETYTDPNTHYALDYRGRVQYLRHYGKRAGSRRRLYLLLQKKEPVDPSKVDLYLLHWAGTAGGFTETLEYRSKDKIMELRSTPGWNLIYDNGESFILEIRALGDPMIAARQQSERR